MILWQASPLLDTMPNSGIFHTQTSSAQVTNRDHSKIKLPSNAYGYRFFDMLEHKTREGGLVLGNPENHSAWTFVGKKLTLADVIQKHPEEKWLISHMKTNKKVMAVQTTLGPLIVSDDCRVRPK